MINRLDASSRGSDATLDAGRRSCASTSPRVAADRQLEDFSRFRDRSRGRPLASRIEASPRRLSACDRSAAAVVGQPTPHREPGRCRDRVQSAVQASSPRHRVGFARSITRSSFPGASEDRSTPTAAPDAPADQKPYRVARARPSLDPHGDRPAG